MALLFHCLSMNQPAMSLDADDGAYLNSKRSWFKVSLCYDVCRGYRFMDTFYLTGS